MQQTHDRTDGHTNEGIKNMLRATIVTSFGCICTSIKFYYIGHWHCMAEEEEMKYTSHSISLAGLQVCVWMMDGYCTSFLNTLTVHGTWG